MANVAIAKAYARRIKREEITLEEVRPRVPSDMFEEVERQLELLG